MTLLVEETGNLSNIFIATFKDGDDEHKLKLDLNELDDSQIKFQVGLKWFQFYLPERMDLHIDTLYGEEIPKEVYQKIYKTLALNNWQVV